MIDREKIAKFLDVLDRLSEEDAVMSISQDGKLGLQVYPRGWWDNKHWTEEKRHQMLALITPLVGRLEKIVDGKNIGYRGDSDGVAIRLSYIDQCKIVGYKKMIKVVEKEIEHPKEYEEIEERIAITDCDIRQGKFSEDDIEVPA